MKKIFFILVLFTFLLTGLNSLADDQGLEQLPKRPILGEGGIIDRITIYLLIILVLGTVICFIISGYFFITAAGDPEKFKIAQRMVLYGIIGLLIAFSAWGIVNLIKVITGGEEGKGITSCGEYCKIQGLKGGNCAPECGLLWGQHWSGGDSFCHSIAPKCCCL